VRALGVAVLVAKVAVTLFGASATSVHGLVVQAPLQPVKVEPASGRASSVTVVPLANVVAQVAPQLIPAGLEATMPLPVPLFPTVIAYVIGTLTVNVAVALAAPS
jgi:hypothetical protein